ncbi:atrophin-1-like [Polistes fuscatus]|uniref:atrophin-1-like n=1 Tax=Polistes fuscatus TaxID=30207 RepID=UPI001CA92C9F|nr:atrophin-1-like [Polistes fuscatus]
MSSASTGGTEGSSPSSSPASATSLTMAAPKYGTLVPNRIFVGGISASTSEAELAELFSQYGTVKATKIIADRAGVSKGYGFVTFETEEEAKRLQQEPESIILRERKLNIAPAIKKQPFNRSFDGGSGSPPSVPSSTYYYANGMGLTYQNGMTFYNAAAPAPGTPIAPPADPATIYQATGVFGPQATTGHQTFAPVMYPCPGPSLYMPQQYQYTPMPYEQYYAGAAAAGASPYPYITSNSQSNTNNGGSNNNSGNNGTGANSPATGPPPTLPSLHPPPPTHFYAPAAPPHHHPPMPAGPPPPQVDLYYSFAAGPPPPPAHAPIGLSDHQLVIYPSDTSCQQTTTSDSQTAPQEDSRSTSSHSEQPHGESQAASSGSATPLVSLMPLKFPMSNRYTNYHPIAIHATNLHNSQTCLNEVDDCSANQMQCRTIVYHPLFIPHTYPTQFHNTSGASLLPTPPSSSQQFESSNKTHLNSRHYTKSSITITPSNYVKTQNHITVINPNTYSKVQSIGNSIEHKYTNVDGTHKYATIAMTPSRLPVQYNKRASVSNVGSPACYLTQKSGNYNSSQNLSKPGNFGSNVNFNNQTYNPSSNSSQKIGNMNINQNFDYVNGRKNTNYNADQYFDNTIGYKSTNYTSGRRNASNNYRTTGSVSANQFDNLNSSSQNNESSTMSQIDSTNSSQGLQTTDSTSSDKPASPPPAPYSPMTRPLPTLSPPTLQVQYYPAAQNRYQPSMPSQHQQQQQQQQQQHSGQRRYTVAPPLSSNRKSTEKYSSANAQTTMLRQSKYKVNSIMQSGGKVSEDSLGGAGDAPPTVSRMPITPPGTSQTHPAHPAGDQNQLSDTCHQIQALTL